MALPFVKVEGRLGITVGDQVDPDDQPEIILCTEGIVKFRPLTEFMRIVSGDPQAPLLTGNRSINCEVGADGRIYYPNATSGTPYVNLLDLTSAQLNPRIEAGNATYEVSFESVRAAGELVEFQSFLISPDPAVTNDITLMAPAVSVDGTFIAMGPPGPPAILNPGTVTQVAPGNAPTFSLDFVGAGEYDLNLGLPAGKSTLLTEGTFNALPYGSTPVFDLGAPVEGPFAFTQPLSLQLPQGKAAPVCYETTPGTYTARIDNTPHIFIGTTNPVALMLDGDTWLDNTDPNTGTGIPPSTPIYGNGSPEGFQVAPVGSEYIDLSATNGARKWYKASGTGNTGWICTQGDTGQRTALSWDAAGTMTKGAIVDPTSWSPDGLQAGGLWTQRRGDVVTVTLERLKAVVGSPSGVIYQLPVGFRPVRGYRNLIDMYPNAAGTAQMRSLVIGTTGNVSRAGNVSILATEVVLQMTWTYTTNDAWPTTLP